MDQGLLPAVRRWLLLVCRIVGLSDRCVEARSVDNECGCCMEVIETLSSTGGEVVCCYG